MEKDLTELKKSIESGNRTYTVLMDYLKFEKHISNIEEIHKDIERMYPKDKSLYVELANCYINNNDINNAIKCLERYRQNNGEDIDVLILLSKKYMDVKSFEKAKHLLEELSAKNKENKEIEDLLFSVEKNLNNINIKEMNENSECSIEDKTNMIFKDKYDINIVTKGIKDILLNVHDEKDILFDKISCFIQKLNLEDKYEETKYFFNEIYNHIPNEYLKLKNILLNEYEIATKQIVLKSYPRRMRIELTHKCNVSCIMCKERKNSSFNMSDKEIEDLLDIMPYIQELTIQGGEVFLDSRFNSIIDSVIKYNPTRVAVITNGLLLNEFWLEKLSKTNIELTFSIDSQKKDIYEKIRVGGSFEKLIDKLKMATKFLKNKKMILNMVVMKCNYKEIEDMIKFASEYGFSEIHLNPVNGDACKEENFFKYKIDESIINEIKDKSDCYERLAKQCDIELLNRLPKKENIEIISKSEIKDKSDCYERSAKQCDIELLNRLPKKENVEIISKSETKDKNNIFCYSPFKEMSLSASGYVPNCECNNMIGNIDTFSEKDNLILQKWNGFVMREYRKAMIEHKENMVCNEICSGYLKLRKNIII